MTTFCLIQFNSILKTVSTCIYGQYQEFSWYFQNLCGKIQINENKFDILIWEKVLGSITFHMNGIFDI